MELIKNHNNTLVLTDGGTKIGLQSEIEPVLIGERVYCEESWENGPTTYNRYMKDTYWIIIQNGQPILIVHTGQYGDYSGDSWDSWKAKEFPSLPENFILKLNN